MRKIELDFVSRPAFGRPVGLLLLLAGVAAAASSALEAADVMEAKASLEARVWAAGKNVRGRAATEMPRTNQRPEELRALREAAEVASRLKLPWQRLFDETAQAAGAEIALTGLQPDPASRTVRIAGLAHDLPAVNRFVGHLQEKPGFAGAYIAQHDTEPKDADAPLGFVVLANLREER